MEEYLDMIIAYGAAGQNARAAARLYAERFPQRARHPSFNIILRCVQRTRETGFLRPRNVGRAVQYCANVDERVLRAFEEDPGLSVRRAAEMLNLSRCMVHHILRRNGLHFITSGYNNFYREITNHAFIFAKVYLLFLFNIFVLFLININNR